MVIIIVWHTAHLQNIW